MKFSDKNRNVNLELPVKISYEGKEFWIKKATKTDGIYLNSEPPKETKAEDVVLPISSDLRK